MNDFAGRLARKYDHIFLYLLFKKAFVKHKRYKSITINISLLSKAIFEKFISLNGYAGIG